MDKVTSHSASVSFLGPDSFYKNNFFRTFWSEVIVSYRGDSIIQR